METRCDYYSNFLAVDAEKCITDNEEATTKNYDQAPEIIPSEIKTDVTRIYSN